MVNLVLPPAPVEEHEEHKRQPHENKSSSNLGFYLIFLAILAAGLWYFLSQGYLSSYLP